MIEEIYRKVSKRASMDPEFRSRLDELFFDEGPQRRQASMRKEASTRFRGRLPYVIRITRVTSMPDWDEELPFDSASFDFRGIFFYGERRFPFTATAKLNMEPRRSAEDTFEVQRIGRREVPTDNLRTLISDLLWNRKDQIREHLLSKKEQSSGMMDAAG